MRKPADISILVVDDIEGMRFLVGEILGGRGYHVTFAEDGLKAWELILAMPFDLVITDIEMPGMNGLDLAKLIKEEKAGLSIFAMTGNPIAASQAVASGYIDVLFEKPFDGGKLLNAVAMTCGIAFLSE